MLCLRSSQSPAPWAAAFSVLSFLLRLRTRAQSLFRLSEAHTMLLWAVIVGLLGAFATVAFRHAIDVFQWTFTRHTGSFVAMARALPWTVRVWLPAAGGLVAGGLLVVARRSADKHANSDYMEAISIGDGVVPVWQSVWRSVSSLFTIGCGGSPSR